MKKIILLLSLLFSIVTASFAQPPNDDCAGAQVITPNGTCVAGTTVAALDNWVGSPGCQINGPDVWYTFTSTGTFANFLVTSGTMGGNVEIILVEATSPCTGLTQIGSTVCGASPLATTFSGLTVGALYYYTISSTGATGTFTACVTNVNGPANDECAGAQVVTPDGTCVAGTTVYANDSWFGIVGCQSVDLNPDVFYSFVSTGTQANFTVTNGTMTGNIEILVVSGACGGTQLQEGNSCGASPLNATINGLTPGVTYFYTISSSTGSQGTFTTCVTTTSPPVTSGQDCATAAILCDNTAVSQGISNAGVGVQELDAVSTCLATQERQSKWFKFTVGCSGTLGFMINPNVNTDDYDFAFFDVTAACPAPTTAALACNYQGTLPPSNDLEGCTGISIYGSGGVIAQPGILANVSCAKDWANPGFQPYSFINQSAGNTYDPLNVTAGNTYALLVDNFTFTNNGFTLTFEGTAIIGPNAAFTMAITNCGLTVDPVKTCTTTNSTFLWTFGDGTTSALQDPPAHTYAVGGAYTVALTVTDALGCSATTNQSVNAATANADIDQTICAGSTVTLAGSIGGSSISGTWSGGGGTFSPNATTLGAVYTPTAANITAGTVTLTLTPSDISGPCPLSADQMIITILPAPVATFSYTGTPYCQNAANPSPTFSGGGVAGTFSSTAGLVFVSTATGQVDLASSTAGTYTVTNTIAAAGGCPPIIATSTITITPLPVATFSYTLTPYCQNAANPSPTYSGGGVAGTFSSTAGLVFVSTATGQVNLSGSTAGTYTVTNTIAAASGCPIVSATSTITITALPVATFSYTATPYCQNAANPSPTFSGGGVAGTFSSTAGLVFVSTATGQVNLSASTAGTYTVTNTIAAASGCPVVTATTTITITPLPVATFSYVATPYCQNAANPSPTYSGGGVAGTFSSTAGLVFVSTATGQVNLSGSTAGTYTVTNTIAAASGCPIVSATSTITITALPVATFSYTATPYCQNAANPSPTFSGGGVAGTFSSTAGLVFVSTATGQVNLSASTAGTYTVTNTIAAASGCPIVTATSTITITPLPVATFSYTLTPYCQNAANPSPTYSGGGVAGTFSSTAGLVFVSTATGQVNLSTSTAGTYTVTNTIAAASGCPIVSATSTITITALPVATFSYTATPYCQNAANPSPTFSGGGVAGTFSSTAGLVFVSTATGQVNLSASTAGTYTVTNTIAAASGCPIVTATSTITITPLPVATFSYTLTPYCQNAANPSPTYSGGGVAGTFSSTAGLVFVSTATGQVNLSASTTGTYTVTNTIAAANGCPIVTATATITISMDDPAFSYSSATYCQTGANPTPTITGLAGGTFSSTAGLVFVSTATGQINLAASTLATYTVTYTTNGPCPNTATFNVTITIAPSAAFSYAGPYCQGGAPNPSPTFGAGASAGTFSSTVGLVFVSTSTGQVNLATSTPGTYTVTNDIAAAGGCIAATATSLITITPLPVATFSYTGTPYCQNAANPSPTFSGGGIAGIFSSTAGLVFVSTATGEVDLVASTLGTYTVTNTIAAASGCPAVTATSTITITPLPIATFSYTATPYCQNAVNPFPTFSGGGVAGTFSSTAGLVFVSTATGEVNLSASIAGTYTVTNTIAAASGCPVVTATSTITITPLPVATFSYTGTPYCQNAANPSPTFSGGGIAGIFSSTAGLVFVSTATGEVDLVASTLGTYTVTNTIAAASGCPVVTATSTITITPLPIGTFSYTATPYCQTAANPFPTFSGGGIAGTFSSTVGLVFVNTVTGEVDLAGSTAGTYTVTNTIAAASGCPVVTATSTITITPLPVATFSYTGTPYCQNAANPFPTFSGGGVGGTFSSTAGLVFVSTVTGEVDLVASIAGTYTVTNTLAAASGCPVVTATSTITITPLPIATFNYPGTPYCQTAANPFPAFSGGGVAGTFSSTLGLVFVNTATGEVNLSASTAGTYTVTNTIAAVNGCPVVTATATLVINPLDDASFGYSSSTYCQTGSNPTPIITGVLGGVFTATPAGISINSNTGIIDLAASSLNTYTVTYTTPGPCINSTTFDVTITTAPSASFNYAGPYCQSGSPDPLPTFGAGASGGVFSSTAGLTLNAITGQITLATSTPGTYTVTNTIVAAGGCAAASATASVVVDQPATVNAGVDTSICAGNTYLLAGSMGGSTSTITWSSATGGTFDNVNLATATFTPSALDITNGNVTLTITSDDPSGPCLSVSDNLILTIGQPATVSAGVDTAICAGDTYSLSGTFGGSTTVITWSSPSGGVFNNANSATATYTPSATDISNGSVILTITSDDPSGACTSVNDNMVLTINQPATANAGVDSAICAGTDYTTAASIGGSATSLIWSTTGSGTFGNISSGSTSYTPSIPDSTAGSVMLIVTSDNPTGACNAVADTMILTINALPNADAGAVQILSCNTVTATLNGASTSAGAGFSWSGPGIVSGGNTAAPIVNAVGTYTLTVNSGSCSNTDTVSVFSDTIVPNADAGTIQTLTCVTLSTSLAGTSTTAGATYSWTGAGIVSGGNTATPLVNVSGIYTLTVTNPSNGCSATDTVSVLNNTNVPDANAGSGQTLTCTATSVNLNASSLTVGATYSWAGSGIVSGGASATPTVNATGTYTVTVTDPSNGCTATSTVIVSSDTTPPVADAGSPQGIGCGILNTTLNGNGSSSGASFSYNWTTTTGNIVSGGTTTQPIVDLGGIYTITVTNTTNGCTATDTVSVSQAPTPVASFTANPYTGTPPLTVNFTNTSLNSNTYIWNFGDGSAPVSLINPTDIYNNSGTYVVTLIASNNSQCPDTAQVTIIVYDDFSIMIPNIFTPNGDANNDIFKVTSTGIESLTGAIYDRWGAKIFEWHGVSGGWDGRTSAGIASTDGTYYYILTVKANDTTEHGYTGYLQLLR